MKTYNSYARCAIFAKYLPATNTGGSKVKAYCERGSITVSFDDSDAGDAASPFAHAVEALLAKFEVEDGSSKSWGTISQYVCGASPRHEKSSYTFVRAITDSSPTPREALAIAEATIQRLCKTDAQLSSVQGTLDVIRTASR